MPNEGKYANCSYLKFTGLCHPCVAAKDKNFIPNDTKIDTSEASLLLVTGPNMGGKSTLLR